MEFVLKWVHVARGKIGGLGAELNREIVSFCACVRAVCMSSEFEVKISGLPLSCFPFPAGSFPFSLPPAPQSPIQLQLALSVISGQGEAIWLRIEPLPTPPKQFKTPKWKYSEAKIKAS